MTGTRLRIAMLIALCCVVLCACDAASRTASHLQRGRSFLAVNNLLKAQIEFRNAAQIAPGNPEAKLMLGEVDERLGDLRGAVSSYQSAIDSNPDNLTAKVKLGRLYVIGGAAERALELVQPALTQHPDDADLLAVRGAARERLKDYGAALLDAERAVQLAPSNEYAVAVLAALYRERGELDRAVTLVSETLKRAPASIDLRQVLASLQLAAGLPQQAEAELREIVARRPGELRYRYGLALFYVGIQRFDDAKAVLRQAIDLQPTQNEPKLAYLEFLSAHGTRAELETAAAEFMSREPRNYELQLAIAALDQQQDRMDAAAGIYSRIEQASGEQATGLMARDRHAAILLARGESERAAALVAEVLRLSPHDDTALALRGSLALQRGAAAGAIADLRAVLRDQPRSVPIMRALARAYVADGQNSLAEDSLRSAAEVAPADAAVTTELAALLAQTHRVDEALDLLTKAIATAPTDTALRAAQIRTWLAKPDLEAARRGAEDLIRLAPQASIGPLLAGVVAEAQTRTDDAVKQFERALVLQPGSVDALTALVRIDVARGRTEQAIARIRTVSTAEPENASAANLLGELYLSSKQYAFAGEEFARATRIAREWWLPYRNLASTQVQLGDSSAAVRTYELGIAAAGPHPVLVSSLGDLYEQQGRIDDAIRQYESLYRSNPKALLAANNLAMLLATYRTDRLSLDRARDLTAGFATSDNPALLDTFGWVRLRRGEVEQALPVLERAAQRLPGSAVAHYHLGMAELQSGRREQAREDLQSALAVSDKFVGAEAARSALAGLRTRSG